MKLLLALVAAACLLTAGSGRIALSQDKETVVETKAEVPALTRFHTVIYKLWHTAWPRKDYDMMAALLPDIEKGVVNVAGAELPGILRDRKAAWGEGVQQLEEVAGKYKEAVEKKDNQKLLDAGERLHSRYERLVRIIRPALKEVDEFHSVLYMLYHYYMPKYTLDSIKTSVTALKEKMVAVNMVQLPGRLKKKEAAFVAARTKLSASVDALANTTGTNDQMKITVAVQAVHSDYEALDKVLQ